jgi:hypothetical protein
MAAAREREWLEGVCACRGGAAQRRVELARVVAAMDANKGDAAVQVVACQVLLLSTASAEALLKAGAHLRVLRAMRLGGGAPLQGAALDVLAVIARSNNNHELLVRLGAEARCVEAMISLVTDALVAKACCAALEQLARTDATAGQLAMAGCHCAVLTAMATHPDDERLQVMACSALWTISSSRGTTMLLVRSAAHEAVIKAMTRHSTSGLLQEHAAGVLANMAVLANCEVLLRAGAEKSLLAALCRHAGDPAVVRIATIALKNLHSN